MSEAPVERVVMRIRTADDFTKWFAAELATGKYSRREITTNVFPRSTAAVWTYETGVYHPSLKVLPELLDYMGYRLCIVRKSG